jgi:hypothetical protein
LDLLDRYTPDMEVQINVAVDGGVLVPGKWNLWTADPDSPSAEQWHHVRVPKNAKGEPERNDWPLRFDLASHVEAIGMTGWDFGKRCSRSFGFDFDAIVGHAEGVGISDAELEAVKAAAWKVPWLEIRKSTGGGGLHLRAICCDDGIPTKNHGEHAAMGRAILEMLSKATGFNFMAKADAIGGNMWVWHRKSSLANEGLKLLKPATERLSAADIPGDWLNHLPVVQRKRATQRVSGVPDSADDEFDQLVSSRKRVPFSAEHDRIMAALASKGFKTIYQHDNHLIQVHTDALAQLADDPAMNVQGIFKTISRGDHPDTLNAFMFPLANGGWRVCRFTPGTKEADTWDQGEGWTSCQFNVRATLTAAAAAEGSYERSDGSYVFDTARQGLAALKGIGVKVTAPDWCADRQMILAQQKKSTRKLVLSIAYQDGDENAPSTKEMRDRRWNLEGSQVKSKRWSQVVTLPHTDNANIADRMLDRFDAKIRSIKTPDGQDAGWRTLDDDGVWVERERTAAKDMLSLLNLPPPEVPAVLAKLQSRNWTQRNVPFQPEFPGGRVWNVGAQLSFRPTDEDRVMVHPHWDSILAHVGQGLNEAVQADGWCITNGVTSGADYLLHWAASLFQRPSQKLPYLFFFGEQESGKSSFNNGLGLLMSRGHMEARNSLLTVFNGELDGAILAFIEEVDLSGKASEAYNRLKDWVTGDKISINMKYSTVYSSPSHLHWIQIANERRFCPIFEGDTRIVVIHVASKPSEDIPWPKLKTKLEKEAPDFLRTLLDLRLPDGVGRLWLPVLDTEAKRQALAESNPSGLSTQKFDPKALENAMRRLLLEDAVGVYKGLVIELLKRLGKGSWSQDPNVFGRQLKTIIQNAHERGFAASSKRVGDGTEVTIEEHWDETNIDGRQEWSELALLAAYNAALLKTSEAQKKPLPLAIPPAVHGLGSLANN